MARKVGRLTALEVGRKKAPGRYPDGGGLYLQITGYGQSSAAAKSWIYRYLPKGGDRERWMGLGSVADVSLADARVLAARYRRQARDGVDPIEARKAEREAAKVAMASVVSFKEAAETYITARETTWKDGGKSAKQWRSSLTTYAYSVIGTLSVGAVETAHVVKILDPIWTTKNETANRVRNRVENILDSAKARGLRSGENPARWKGHLNHILPPKKKAAKASRAARGRTGEHHPALPYNQIGAFVEALRAENGTAARGLEFLILAAARSKEVRLARRPEIDLAAKVWTIPAGRMKGEREHRVPLSARAIEIITTMLTADAKPDAYIFPGGKAGKPMSDGAMLALLDRMEEKRAGGWCDKDGRPIVTHGFRSTFRTWAAEQTGFPAEIAEAALAHANDDKTEEAYQRGELLDKRERLMTAWANYIARAPKSTERVVSINRRWR